MAFKKGISGNPLGRPTNTITVARLRQSIIDDMPDIIAAIVAQAKTGDMTAAKLLMDRVIPVLKPATEPVTFDIAANDTVSSTGQALIDSMSRAEISPDACTDALKALGEHQKLTTLGIDTGEKVKQAKEDAQFNLMLGR